MSRVIKFRAWKGERMVTSDEVGLPQLFMVSETEREALMQFTGLTDKNGKEIYEGDVVRRSCVEDWEKDSVHDSIGKVYWADESASFHIGDTLPLDWGGIKSYEVIGNIYENSDLLKV